MKEDRTDLSFCMAFPARGNIYERVVVASLRARQLNDYPQLRDRDRPGHLVEQALREAATDILGFHILDKPDDGSY